MTFSGFLFVYVLGGLTFLPLVLGLVVLHAYLTFPTRLPDAQKSRSADDENATLLRQNDDEYSLKTGTDRLVEQFNRKHEADVAAGYFAVCREYVPGGVNGKPPERTTPAGEVVASESPSVYQSMYRSIFDRKEKPTVEPNKGGKKSVKKGRNVFFVVLRHGHLMLYDDVEQIEVRHVISLEHHDVSIYGGGDDIPEGELWIKRNAICLRRKRLSAGDMGVTSLPFFLFSENQSEKEDFYFALLTNQQKIPGDVDAPPEPLHFETGHIVKLVQQLHSSQEHLETRWLNALAGRLFLALYRTSEAEAFIRKKIVKKISRVKKPTFITKIVLQKIEMGHSGPFILNPRLRDLTVNGDCTVEADVKYAGDFRLEIAATARIDLGQRFKAREVDLVLAVVLRKLEGHALLRLKPPPSNRLWFSFETMPKIEMTIEPIVSTRQITYSVILRTIESRIKEVIAESLVLPFWDDMAFLDTDTQQFRGGIWKQEPVESKHEEIKDEDPEDEVEAGSEAAGVENLKQPEERTMSMPTIPIPPPNVKLRGNKSAKVVAANDSASASTTGIDKIAGSAPRSIRSNSFATPAEAKVTNANADSVRRDSLNTLKKDAAAAIKEISDRSLSTSPSESPFGSPPTERIVRPQNESAASILSKDSDDSASTQYISRPASHGSLAQNMSQTSLTSGQATSSFGSTPPKRKGTLASLSGSISSVDKKQSLASISAATAAARKWGLGMVGRDAKENTDGRPGTPEHPIGRGRPFPPLGQPLPPPDRSILRSMPALPKRKAVPPRLPERPVATSASAASNRPPLPERRKQRSASAVDEEASDEVMVVQAPAESAPTTPTADEAEEGFFGRLEENEDVSTEPMQPEKPEKPALPARVPSTSAIQVQNGEPVDIEGALTQLASETQGYDAA